MNLQSDLQLNPYSGVQTEASAKSATMAFFVKVAWLHHLIFILYTTIPGKNGFLYTTQGNWSTVLYISTDSYCGSVQSQGQLPVKGWRIPLYWY